MLSQLNQFYLEQSEPNRNYFLALREFINNYDEQISEEWKYKLPFFTTKTSPSVIFGKFKKQDNPILELLEQTK